MKLHHNEFILFNNSELDLISYSFFIYTTIDNDTKI